MSDEKTQNEIVERLKKTHDCPACGSPTTYDEICLSCQELSKPKATQTPKILQMLRVSNCDSEAKRIVADLLEALDALVAALVLYVNLDNDRRAGCRIRAEDWAECHQAATRALAKARGK